MMKTYECTTAKELPAVETMGGGLAMETAGTTARGGAIPLRVAFTPPNKHEGDINTQFPH